jgi:hypothetical protein
MGEELGWVLADVVFVILVVLVVPVALLFRTALAVRESLPE